MKDIMEIKQLSREEKLRVMEAIWEDLSSEEQSLQSPTWHESALKETEQRVQSGHEQILDWKEAKKELQKRFE
ncbi:MAG: addiction module protein [Nitrospira sp.]|nr:addiction module protein [Nitrospira sp.]